MRHRTALLILTTVAVVGACSGQTPTASPSPEPSAAQSQASATSSPLATPTPTPEPSGTVHFTPGSNAPLEDAVFGALRPAADGFWLIGMSQGFTTPFLLKGSADGATWTQLDVSSIDGNLVDIAEGTHGTVLAQVTSDPNTGDQATTLWHSSDGAAFQPVDAQADLDKASVANVFAGPSGFAAVGQIMSTSDENTNRIWTSEDGRTWKSAAAPSEGQVDQVVLTDQGYIGIDTGLYGSVPAEYVSKDGLTWSRAQGGSHSPFGTSDTTLSTPVVVGNTVSTVRSDGTVWSGAISAGDAGPTIDWRHLTDADPTFAGAQVLSAAASASGATMLGFDRKTLQPASWHSADGVDWRSEPLAASTFGGGVSTLLARSGDVDATLGFEVNSDGFTVRRPWASSTNGWAISDVDLFGVMPAVASGPCPATPPTDPDKLAAIPAPLRPTCFGHEALHLTGFVGSCECGGTSLFEARPRWLTNDGGFAPMYIGGQRPNDTQLASSLPVWFAAGAGMAEQPFARHVAVTGHFDDPASADCRIFPMSGVPNDLTPKEAAIAECRQHFVATAIQRR